MKPKPNGTCPHDGTKLDPETEFTPNWLQIKLYCTKCDYVASACIPWEEFEEDA
jgi:hypothetical protein